MTHGEIERAWRDRHYRTALSPAKSAALPDHPSGVEELPDDLLDDVGGGGTTPICAITTAPTTVVLSCWINCDTVVRGTCGFFSVGCCGGPDGE